jgi:electron transport complex protein RnfE
MGRLSVLTRGIVKENPVLVLILGTCPTLAVSTQASNAVGMGIAATAVLLCSNIAVSLLRKVIPDKVRIPSFIVLIAGFVTIVQMVVEAYSYSLYQALGIYLPLIVVNCIILGRAEMFRKQEHGFKFRPRRHWDGHRLYAGAAGDGVHPRDPRQRNLVRHADPLYGRAQHHPVHHDDGARRFIVFGLLIALVNKITKAGPRKKLKTAA